MRKTIRKWFWIWNFDKEERWLNDMGRKGLALVAVGYGKYTFEECIPGSYNVRLELLDNIPTHAESQQYIKFIEETGAEYLGSVMRWVYFRNKTDSGEFNLYSDRVSRLQHLNRILMLMGVVSIASIAVGLGNISIYFGIETTINLICGIFNMSIGLFLTYGFFLVYLKKRKLKQEQNLFE